MIICFKCAVEMQCQVNGVMAHYGGGHAHAGDLWRCPKCKNEVLNCNKFPLHLTKEDLAKNKYKLLEMKR